MSIETTRGREVRAIQQLRDELDDCRGSHSVMRDERSAQLSSPPLRETAQATVEPTPDCGQETVYEAIEQLPVEVPEGWSVEVECGGDTDRSGQAEPSGKVITVWPDVLYEDEHMEAVLLHEIGHALDFEMFGVRERRLWTYARGLEGSWSVCSNALLDEDCWFDPSEDFAEAVAVCVSGQESWHEEFRAPSRAECALLASLVGWSADELAD